MIEIQGIKICILLHWYSSIQFFLPLEVYKTDLLIITGHTISETDSVSSYTYGRSIKYTYRLLYLQTVASTKMKYCLINREHEVH